MSSPPPPRPDAPPVDRFRWILDRSERAFAAGDRAAGLADLLELAGGEFPPHLRAWAAARLVQMSPPASELEKLPAAARTALQPALMSEWLLNADGLPVTLDAFVRQHLGKPAPASSAPVAITHKPCVDLGPDLEVSHTRKLPPGVSPLPPVAGAGGPANRLFAAGPEKVVAIPLDRSAETEHTAPGLFTHASDLAGGFVAAGPDAVALYGAARDPVWVFRVPVTDPLTPGPLPFALCGAGEPVAPPLSSFRLAGPWLLARLGEFHLIALDLGAKRVAWVLGATGRSGYEASAYTSTPRFGPHFAVCGRFVVAQLSDGRRWFVRLETGRPAPQPSLGDKTALVSWPHAPAEIGDNLFVLADGPGTVRLVQPGGRVRWCFEAEYPEGLTGEPPQVRAFEDVLVVAVRRNHGVELECLNLGDGKPQWEPVFVDADRVDLSAAGVDGDCLFVPAGNVLLAFSWDGGKLVWRAKLPDAGPAGWVARVALDGGVVVCPREAIPREPPAAVRARLATSFRHDPQLWRLPGLAATLYDAWVGRAVPVLLFDPETGERLARLDVPARGPAAVAALDANAAAVATGDRVVWLK